MKPTNKLIELIDENVLSIEEKKYLNESQIRDYYNLACNHHMNQIKYLEVIYKKNLRQGVIDDDNGLKDSAKDLFNRASNIEKMMYTYKRACHYYRYAFKDNLK